MSETVTRTITLTADQAAFIDALVAGGEFASADEVIQAGLQILQDPEPVEVQVEDQEAYDQWLRDEVIPVYEDAIAHPEQTIPAEEVFAEVYALIEARQQQRNA